MTRSELLQNIKEQALVCLSDLTLVDLDKGQFDGAIQNYPSPLPVLLVYFGQWQYSGLCNNYQIAQGTITLNLYMNMFGDSFSGANGEEQSIQVLNREKDLFQTFQSFYGMKRINASPIRYGKDYAMVSVTFAIEVTEDYDDGFEQTEVNNLNIQRDINE